MPSRGNTNKKGLKTMRKKTAFFLKLFIGVSILILLLYRVGIKSIYINLSSINLLYLPLILVLIGSIFLINALNINILLKSHKKDINFFTLLRYVCTAYSLSIFTPGKVGELSLIYFLKKNKLSLGEASAVVIMDKLITIVITCFFGIFGIFYFFSVNQSINITIILLVIFCIILFSIFNNKGRGIIKKYILKSYSVKFKNFHKYLVSYPNKYKREIMKNAFLTFLRLMVSSLSIFLIFLALGKNVPIMFIFLIKAATVVISFVPLSPNGLGIKESLGVYLYSRIGIASSIVGGMYIVVICLDYFIATTFVLLFLNKIQLGNIKNGIK